MWINRDRQVHDTDDDGPTVDVVVRRRRRRMSLKIEIHEIHQNLGYELAI